MSGAQPEKDTVHISLPPSGGKTIDSPNPASVSQPWPVRLRPPTVRITLPPKPSGLIVPQGAGRTIGPGFIEVVRRSYSTGGADNNVAQVATSVIKDGIMAGCRDIWITFRQSHDAVVLGFDESCLCWKPLAKIDAIGSDLVKDRLMVVANIPLNCDYKISIGTIDLEDKSEFMGAKFRAVLVPFGQGNFDLYLSRVG